jgi:hypothetical protein
MSDCSHIMADLWLPGLVRWLKPNVAFLQPNFISVSVQLASLRV